MLAVRLILLLAALSLVLACSTAAREAPAGKDHEEAGDAVIAAAATLNRGEGKRLGTLTPVDAVTSI